MDNIYPYISELQKVLLLVEEIYKNNKKFKKFSLKDRQKSYRCMKHFLYFKNETTNENLFYLISCMKIWNSDTLPFSQYNSVEEFMDAHKIRKIDTTLFTFPDFQIKNDLET